MTNKCIDCKYCVPDSDVGFCDTSFCRWTGDSYIDPVTGRKVWENLEYCTTVRVRTGNCDELYEPVNFALKILRRIGLA